MNKKILSIFIFALLLCSCKQQSRNNENNSNNTITIIFETDMGNDIDDALALDMLHKYQDAGIVKLLGISINKNNVYAPQFIDIMDTWYGYPDIPIALVRDGIEDTIPVNFGQAVCEYKGKNGYKFERSISDYTSVTNPVYLYRKLLASQPNNSVAIVSVGFFTNLSRLLDSPADDTSPLMGKELVAKKVKILSLMGGNFNGVNPHEYNVVKDIESAKRVFDEWPTRIVVSPFEVGNAILFPGSVIENDLNYTENHPLKIAYESYLPMPYDRPTWDLTSVLYVVEEDRKQNYFQESAKGTINVDSLGATYFEPKEDGKHLYLKVDSIQSETIKKRFVELIKQKPSSIR